MHRSWVTAIFTSVAMEVGEYEGGDLCVPGVQHRSSPVPREGRCRVPAGLGGDTKPTAL